MKIKIFKCILILFCVLLIVFEVVRSIGRSINRKVPEGGINETAFVEINGTWQWINIYGKDLNNPVLLYLHGGPGTATSPYDYVFTRKWADAYTVVTWDQRNCGKSYDKKQNGTEFTYDMFMQDGKEMTEFLQMYFKKDKITILGHSWGTFFGANLVLNYPEYYEAYIGTGQIVNIDENEQALTQAAKKWAKGDKEDKRLLSDLDGSDEHKKLIARQRIMEKYGYDMFAQGRDYSLAKAMFFNPYYSLWEFVKYLRYFSTGFKDYEKFLYSTEFKKFSLNGRYSYKVPYYNINGDRDYQTNWILAQEYFDLVEAPFKKMYIMKDMTHGLLESRSKEFSDIIHEIKDSF